MFAATHPAFVGLTTIVLGVVLQATPPGGPSSAPTLRPPTRERVTRPEDVYKPSKKDNPRPEYVDPPAKAGDAPAPVPAPEAAAPAPAPVPEPADPNASNVADNSAPPSMPNAAPRAAPKAGTSITATAIGADDYVILGILALVVIVPLGIGLWWILVSRGGSSRPAGERA